jgi:uncharacterized membrane protein YfcA
VAATWTIVRKMDRILPEAAARTSVLTHSSLAVFAGSGIVDYPSGLALMAGNAVGGYVGAHIAVRSGDRWVRRLFGVVVLASAARLVFG